MRNVNELSVNYAVMQVTFFIATWGERSNGVNQWQVKHYNVMILPMFLILSNRRVHENNELCR